jgi:hypothetical protein
MAIGQSWVEQPLAMNPFPLEQGKSHVSLRGDRNCGLLTKGHSALIARSPMWGRGALRGGSSAGRGSDASTCRATVCRVGLSARGGLLEEPPVRPLFDWQYLSLHRKICGLRTGMQLPLPGLALATANIPTCSSSSSDLVSLILASI